MIKVSIDEASTFDILSILLIKTHKSADSQHVKNYINFVADIKDEIGLEKLYQVMNSAEFADLRAANVKVFDGVNLAKTNDILASELDTLNHQRYICKQKIQNKFFGNNLTEQKIGYE